MSGNRQLEGALNSTSPWYGWSGNGQRGMTGNRQPELYAAALITYTAAATALVLRMVARRTMRMRMVWEDYLAIVAFLVGSGFTFISLYKMRWGLGKHIYELDPNMDVEHHYFLELWFDMWFYTFSVGLSKFVILGFYWRLFSRSFIRLPIRILFGCSTAWIVARVFLTCLQCIPIHTFWDRGTLRSRSCFLTPMATLCAAAIPHLIIEVAILVCPLVEIWRLHLTTAKKMAVGAMFASGFLVCCSAMGTIIHTVSLNQHTAEADVTWDGLDDQIWAVCDVNLASLSTSLPLLRPVFHKFGGIFSGLGTSSGQRSNGGTNPSPTRTFGSGPSSGRPRLEGEDDDSMIEFAHEGNCKAYALHDMSASHNSDIETGDCIHVQTEMTVEYGKA
ncbi:hypothetical protein HBI56_010590 [Parastagonospora nodorum]|nr:hypothetical protein HBH51_012330 [Parastagonospora nodorum]KAH4001275.1 hypothetical protein HBI10_094750 [Parastagonospora nodorum]KAH4033479.1 hypothetical protein HBI13_011000 [Parastagonospora nodorum]KAH4073199.1 hypothetical protein HBH50_051100 [Parastagonospora nodorum]KAH4099744.1 hypothetical protein HBH48_011060 [Parastagonospora nodorum]